MDDTLLQKIDSIDWFRSIRFVIECRHFIFGAGMILGVLISIWDGVTGQQVMVASLGLFLMVHGASDFISLEDGEEEAENDDSE